MDPFGAHAVPQFQSLKRDVAFFHLQKRANARYRERVSIAQARCGLLPLAVYQGHKKLEWRVFQSLKRDVAFFHAGSTIRGPGISKCFNRSSAMWPSSTATSSCFLRKRRRVSIAQARCGLLPHQYHDAAQDGQLGGFNRSSAMWPSSTLSMLNVETITVGFQSLK